MGTTVRPAVRIEDDTTREQLAEVLTHLNMTAKALRRRGPVGIRGAEYARVHAQIDHVLGDWQAAAS